MDQTGAPDSTAQYVVAAGHPFNGGMALFGPWVDAAAACEWADRHVDEYHVVTLNAPTPGVWSREQARS